MHQTLAIVLEKDQDNLLDQMLPQTNREKIQMEEKAKKTRIEQTAQYSSNQQEFSLSRRGWKRTLSKKNSTNGLFLYGISSQGRCPTK